ncbi:DUF3967 domain-containing protein [Streptococcus agalactiae]|uniref:DUF3967 domain-containing protein n=1 Tax=Streptococcus agalactiae TaxID=1311 RepID=UPI002554D3CE|nr:DUF3967 domain-containing protein [Streptococcus agalactiae]MDK8747717.1 DUF3967 domain-containing protein [Streptococcus agalactiae]
MTDNADTKQSIYNSSDMSTLLKIQESTLRKYCIMLEEAGYKFHKNELGHRGFLHNDVIALKRLIEIKKHPDMTIKQACNAVVTWIKETNVTDRDTDDITTSERHDERYNGLLNEFKEFKVQQEQFNKELINQLQKQQEYIQNSLLERDKNLMKAIRETQETQKLIAAAEEEKRTKKWWKIWRS